MAAMSRDKEIRARWIERANECLILAQAFAGNLSEASSAGETSPVQGQHHRQKPDRRE
jgi:hypothetical protein